MITIYLTCATQCLLWRYHQKLKSQNNGWVGGEALSSPYQMLHICNQQKNDYCIEISICVRHFTVLLQEWSQDILWEWSQDNAHNLQLLKRKMSKGEFQPWCVWILLGQMGWHDGNLVKILKLNSHEDDGTCVINWMFKNVWMYWKTGKCCLWLMNLLYVYFRDNSCWRTLLTRSASTNFHWSLRSDLCLLNNAALCIVSSWSCWSYILTVSTSQCYIPFIITLNPKDTRHRLKVDMCCLPLQVLIV